MPRAIIWIPVLFVLMALVLFPHHWPLRFFGLTLAWALIAMWWAGLVVVSHTAVQAIGGGCSRLERRIAWNKILSWRRSKRRREVVKRWAHVAAMVGALTAAGLPITAAAYLLTAAAYRSLVIFVLRDAPLRGRDVTMR